MQINTEDFQIIYPTDLSAEGNRMANTLQFIISRVSKSLNTRPKKISVILQNQGTTSNGFVQLAPRRSEYFTTPPQEFDYQDWLNSLAVHELRHVVQFDKTTGKLNAPFFEELALAIFGVTLPPWFYEGDAVGMETALTDAGRGRLPSWELTFRTNTLSGSKYSYSKNYLGSVADLTPGYYQLGYFMTSKLRRDYGAGILDSIFTRVSKTPYRPYSLSNSVRKYTGLNTRELHDSTVAELSRLWTKQSLQTKSITYPDLNMRSKDGPENFYLPVTISDTETIVIKDGIGQTPAFFKIGKDGKETMILKIGFQEQPHFNYAAGKIVWDEYRFDKRFQKRSYNVINIYDLKTKSYKQLTHKSRLFAPSLSPDGMVIAAVNVSTSNRISIVELDPVTGLILKEYANPDNLMLQTPAFNSKGNKIVVTGVSQEGSTLLELERGTGQLVQLIPFQKQQISRPSYANEQVVYRAHYNGIDNIYRFDRATSQTFQLTQAPYGAFNPTYHAETSRIMFNNYTPSGFSISSFAFNDHEGTSTTELRNTFINYAVPLVNQESDSNIFDSIPHEAFQSRPYREWKNLFYFHSLALIAEDENGDKPTLGLKLLSNNKLNTLDFYLGYQYDSYLKRDGYVAGFTYKKFYPIVDTRYINRAMLFYYRQGNAGETDFTPVLWRENFTEAEVSVPFIFNRLNQVYQLGFRTSTSYTSRYNIQNKPENFSTRLRFPMKYQLYLNRNSRRSARDLAPVWGQNLTLTYRHFPFEKTMSGDLFTLRSIFYTPGLFRNHSFQARFNYQLSSGAYDNTIDIPLVNGYYNLQPVKELSNTLLFDYRFPLFYPDWEIGPLAYVKRFKGGVFVDFENINLSTFSARVFGAEISADMNLLRFYLPNFEVSGKVIFVNQKPFQNPIFETGFSYNF
ncbi:hypothetical protein GZH53_07210 [Flavihumibacter sp. R14]|nr:hypothetical protein [Flavihumibacter soli]